MTLEQIFITGLTLGCSVLGWFARQMWDAVQALRKDLAALEVKILTDYVRYDRLQDALQPIMKKLEKIEEKLESNRD